MSRRHVGFGLAYFGTGAAVVAVIMLFRGEKILLKAVIAAAGLVLRSIGVAMTRS